VLALAGTTVLALTTFKRDIGGSVTAKVHSPDGIEVYLDEAQTQVANDVAFGTVNVDLFGTAAGGDTIPVWVHNYSLSTARISVGDDFSEGDVAFNENNTTLGAGQTLAGELSLNFSSSARGDFDFVITFRAEGPIASPVPAPTPTPGPLPPSITMSVALDNVGSPLFDMGRGTWPDVLFHGFFGFMEPLLSWEPTYDSQGNPIVTTGGTCHAPYLATRWEWDLPLKSGGTSTIPGNDIGNLDPIDLSDPDNQGVMRVFLREDVDFYRSVDGDLINIGRITAEDVAWSFNDAGSENPNSQNSNSSQAYENWKPWRAVSDFVVEAPGRTFRANGLPDASSMCQDAIWIQSKTLHDELGDTFGVPHGTGPFVVHEWLPSQRIEAESRVDHWRKNPAFDNIVFIQVNIAQQRTAMLETGAVDIALPSIDDVGRLEQEGFKFHEGLDIINGNFFYFAGNNWSFKYPPGSTFGDDDLSGLPMMRAGFIPTEKYPWIGDPRLECVGIDRSNAAIQDTPGAGCDVANFEYTFDGYDPAFTPESVGFDYTDTDRFSYETPSMLKAKAFRKALLHSINRELIAATVTGGYGESVYGGALPGPPFHQSHPEYKDRWNYAFDPGLALEFLAESGVEPGFRFEFFCSQGNGTSLEVCETTVAQWKENLGLDPFIDSSQYSSRRPSMLGRELHVPWMTRWGATSKQGRQSADGGAMPSGGLWPLPAGGWNPSLEDNRYWADREETRAQPPGSTENLASRAAIVDWAHDMALAGGVVEVPVLFGFNADTIERWNLNPWEVVNSFEYIVPAGQ
jgi:ABC-type transport system substrate-binding protein